MTLDIHWSIGLAIIVDTDFWTLIDGLRICIQLSLRDIEIVLAHKKKKEKKKKKRKGNSISFHNNNKIKKIFS